MQMPLGAGCGIWQWWWLPVVTRQAKSGLPAGNAPETAPAGPLTFSARLFDSRMGLRVFVAVCVARGRPCGSAPWAKRLGLASTLRPCARLRNGAPYGCPPLPFPFLAWLNQRRIWLTLWRPADATLTGVALCLHLAYGVSACSPMPRQCDPQLNRARFLAWKGGRPLPSRHGVLSSPVDDGMNKAAAVRSVVLPGGLFLFVQFGPGAAEAQRLDGRLT